METSLRRVFRCILEYLLTTPTDVFYAGLSGSDHEFNFPFDYLDPENVRVFLNEALVSPEVYEVDGNTLRWKAQPYPIGDLLVSRFTPINNKEVEFFSGALRTADLNRQNDQFIFALQEMQNRGTDGTVTVPDVGNPGSGPVIDDPASEGPLVDYINDQIDAYNLQVQSALANLAGQINAFEQTSATLSTEVDGWQALLDNLSSSLDGRISTLEISSDDIAATISQLQTETDDAHALIRQLQLTTTEGQASLVTQLDSRVGDLESNFTSILNVQGQLSQSIQSLESSDGQHTSNIQTLLQTTASQTTRLNDQQTLVNGVQSQIGQLQITSDDLTSSLNTLVFNTGAVENRVSTLETANDTLANRVSNVESSNGDITARVTTLEQTSASGNALAIQQIQTDVDDLQNSVTIIQTTTADSATQISQLASQGTDFSSRIGTLETTTNGLSSSVSALNSRVGDAEADITQIAQTAASADGKASAIIGFTLDANGHISGMRQSNNGVRSDTVFTTTTFKLARPGLPSFVPFQVNTSTGKVSMYDVEVNKLAAESIKTENLEVGSVSATLADRRGVFPLPSNKAFTRLTNYGFHKRRTGTIRFDLVADVAYNNGVEAGVEFQLRIDGSIVKRFYFKPDTYFRSTYSSFIVTDMTAGLHQIELWASAGNTNGGVSGMSIPDVTSIITDLRA